MIIAAGILEKTEYIATRLKLYAVIGAVNRNAATLANAVYIINWRILVIYFRGRAGVNKFDCKQKAIPITAAKDNWKPILKSHNG